MAEENKDGSGISQDMVDQLLDGEGGAGGAESGNDGEAAGGELSQDDIDGLLGGGEDGSAAAEGDEDEQARLAAEWANALETGAEIEEGKGIPSTTSAEPAKFNELPGDQGTQQPPRDLDFILDIPLEVTVEIGRTKMLINDLLQIGQGSVIELNRLAGEPLDILVNSKLIARGEVVVVSEKFGIRITDIVSPMERVKRLA